MGDILKDSRFSKLLNDPRYRQIPKHERKVKIDKRFESMFNDEKFKVKYTVDKRGRPINETSTENLRKYYDVDSNEDDSSDDESGSEEVSEKEKSGDSADLSEQDVAKTKRVKSKLKKKNKKTSVGQFVKPLKEETGDDLEEEVLLEEKNDKLVRGKLDRHITNKLHDMEIDYARGEGVLLTDSSSDDDSSDQETDESDLEHNWGELDADAESIDESTQRLAICNMDWDNIKANDIMVLLNSFLPTGGVIKKITIYPSDYGIKRMKEEDLKGPLELTKKNSDDVVLSDHSDNEEGSKYHMEKLRKYQLNRLKYYYAVVECDSVNTADKLYSECNGLEYESSSTKLDLRFIPDDVTFEQQPREVCTKLPDLSKYRPRMFTTTALQQSKVNLTWDVTNPNRSEAIKNAMDGGMDEADLKEYLASSSDDSDEEVERQEGLKIENVFQNVEEEDEDDVDPIQKYKSLLQDIQQKEQKKKNKDVEMEVTWGLGVKEKAEELVKKKITEGREKQTPFEELMEKRRERKKQKKLERKQKIEALKGETSTGENNEHSDNDIPSDVDMNDPYFAEEFNSAEFKKNKKKKKHESDEEIDEEEERRKAELELLLDDGDDGKAHFSLKKIQASETETKKSRRKKKLKEKIKEIKNALPDFEINTKDERFSAIYNSHLYNIDPTDSNYKKTKGMEKLIEEKLKRRPAEMPIEEVSAPKKTKEEAELSILVKNIKRKTKNIVK